MSSETDSTEQDGASTTDYEGLVEEAKADVRPGEEGYVQDPDKARFTAEAQDRYETRAQSSEKIAEGFTQLADEREDAGRGRAAREARADAEHFTRRAEKQREKIDGVVEDAGDFYDKVSEDKAA